MERRSRHVLSPVRDDTMVLSPVRRAALLHREPVRMPLPELLEVLRRYLTERNSDAARSDSETPQGIAKLLRQGVAVERPALHQMLAHVCERFARLLGEPRSGIHQAAFIIECGIDRPRCRVLIRVQLAARAHAYVTRGSAFA